MALPLALSQGDPAGIGPELAIKAWVNRVESGVPPFLFFGDPRILKQRASLLGFGDVPVVNASPETTVATFSEALPVFAIDAACPIDPGRPDPMSAPGTISAIETSVKMTMRGKTAAVVTNPIAKSVLYEAGFKFPGHTEFLAELAMKETGERYRPVMMLSCPSLKVVPVTIHIPLADVPAALTSDLIVETARITAQDLTTRFGIKQPVLAFSGLNPHAGESGTIGREDEDIIRPALQILEREGLKVKGPLPADTMFHAAARSSYDVALCMYHDQALIPVKTLGFEDGVNSTLGLPFVRTSPDHGTAFAIADKGVAAPSSLMEALKLAAQISSHGTGR
ncbi:4-hydroxythreonine-4-phosphate dehydrogenase PdxA [Martelella mediterranea]|uniref:4-hydroxythreonine-4-phosphate dehydrogenase n=1 Tax=Martelella mediterranea TaxID=293089 RepID=A0A4R3NUX9_9HYPH|nr:4-hydroxythreonine-4-phosphate dehydrogenase PdxA [Martelella mediterranea]TCT36423.1 4-hydroxythreonine-4-phosphate dehydrogenase [Martelella mediterranea]